MKILYYKIKACCGVALLAATLFAGGGALAADAVKKPETVKESAMAEEPVAPEEPTASEEPAAPEEPTASEKPATSEEPTTQEPELPDIRVDGLWVSYKDNADREPFYKEEGEKGVYYFNDTVTLSFAVLGEYAEQDKVFAATVKDGVKQLPDMELEPQEGMDHQYALDYKEDGTYSVMVWGQDEAGNVGETKTIDFVVDQTAPIISDVICFNAEGVIAAKHDYIYSNQETTLQFTVSDAGTGVAEEELFVTAGTEKQNGMSVHKAGSNIYYIDIMADMGVSEFDGTFTIWATDMLGNESAISSAHIKLSAAKPEIQMYDMAGNAKWTNQDITFQVTAEDNRCGLEEIVYRMDGKEVKRIVFDEMTQVYQDTVTATKTALTEKGYTVEVLVRNHCGTQNSIVRRVYIDKEKPEIHLSGAERNMHYNSERTIVADVKDVSYKDTEVVYQIKREFKGQTEHMEIPKKTLKKSHDQKEHVITGEGRYEIYAVAIDGAGNEMRSDSLHFVIDKTAPALFWSGVEEGSMNAEPVTINFRCVETFFDTAHVVLTAERVLDGKKTEEYIKVFQADGENAGMQHTFSKDGTYRVTISATDKAGNEADSQTVHFSVDRTKPKIKITGTDNYEMWNRPVKIRFSVTESYYLQNRVYISGTRRDIDGKIHKVELPAFSSYNRNSSVTHTFERDGVYELLVASRDGAGNRSKKRVHFTIDRTAPEIYKVKDYDGGCYEKFCLAKNLAEVFRDLTVISYKIFLNGIEYNGTDTIYEPGKYELYVEVFDELGHVSRQSAEFVIENRKQGGENEEKSLAEVSVNEHQRFNGQKESREDSTEKTSGSEKGKSRDLPGTAVFGGITFLVLCLSGLYGIAMLKRRRKGRD